MPVRRRITRVLALAALFTALTATASLAATAPWDVVVTGSGLLNARAITAAAVTPSVDGVPSVLTVAVTETAKVADGNPWSVQVGVSDFTQTLDNGGTAPETPLTISRSKASLSAPTTVDLGGLLGLTSTPGSGGTYAHGGSETLQLFRVSGQQDGMIYTNVYTSAANLTVDMSGVPALGTYRSTVTVTLGN